MGGERPLQCKHLYGGGGNHITDDDLEKGERK